MGIRLRPKLALIAVLLAAAMFPVIAVSKDPRPVDLPLKDMMGRKVRLRDYRGKVVVLNFWATWCVPCREEMPMFVEVEKEFALRGVVFIAASLDDRQTRPQIPDFLAKFNIGFPVWVGASTMDLDDLKLGQGVPATAFLDREGRIVARVLGQVSKDQLKERLDWLTGDRSGAAPEPLVQNLPGK
ncbi:MAG: TlpA disulfide reductase family protein [Candidatus Solibacter sp.]|nr:TlpA disulfide reductase family protein [Candidatus Solibacter sp.]